MTNAEPSDSGSHFCIFNCMKIFLLFLTVCFAIANAQFYYDKHGECRGAYKDSLEHAMLVNLAKRFHGSILVKKSIKGVKPRKNLKNIPQNKIQRTFNVSRDTLNKENWLEVEKNEIVKICVDKPVVAWETSLNSSILNDSCLAFQAPMYVGVETLNVYFPESDSPHKINLAVGMKYLNFKNEEVKLGFNRKRNKLWTLNDAGESDPERFVSITGTYLVDEYPVTNCEFMQLMWDSIPTKVTKSTNPTQKNWIYRKNYSIRNGKCLAHDSAANTVYLQQAMKYANIRSVQEGLKPYYNFSSITLIKEEIVELGKYAIGNWNFSIKEGDNAYVLVSIDSTSDGYRLPYYNEWMMLARGGEKKKNSPWDDDSTTLKKYAKFATVQKEYDSDSVGLLQPNGYGLYDVFGLVWEHVLFETVYPDPYYDGHPACLKGGGNRVVQSYREQKDEFKSVPHWKDVNYGIKKPNWGSSMGGFRLIRNIGNNAKWERKDSIVDDKSVDD